MTIDTTTLSQAPATFQRARAFRLPRSPKVIAGLVILGVFGVVAVIGRWITPYSPNATDTQNWVKHVLVPGTGGDSGFPASYYPLPFGPSAAHWLGTTVFAQDAWSQLLASTQATMFVGLIAAAIATVLSIIFGVTAGYLTGRERLSRDSRPAPVDRARRLRAVGWIQPRARCVNHRRDHLGLHGANAARANLVSAQS